MLGAESETTMGTEDTRNEIERRYRSLVEHSLQGIAILQENRFAYVNRAYADLFGYTPDEMLAMSPYEGGTLIHPEDRPRVAQQYFNRLKGVATPNRYEFRAFRKDGAILHIETFISITEYEGRPAVQTVVVDVTDRHRSEEALREVEQRFQALAESTSAGIFIYQGEKTVYVNPAASKLTGYAEEELLAMPFWEVVHPDQRETVRTRGRSRQEGKEVLPRYEVKILMKGGETRWLDFSARTVEHEGKPAVLGTVFDITERNRAERALRESEEKYRSTLEAMPDGIHVVDRDLRIILFNPAFSKWMAELGFDPDPAGRNLFDYLSFLTDRVRGEYETVFETGKVLATEESTELSSRHFFTHALKIPVVREGRTTNVITVVRNVTDRKTAEQALRESESKFRTLAEESPSMIFIARGRRVLYANRRAEELSGYSREELNREGFDFGSLVAPESQEAIQSNFAGLFRGENQALLEYKIRTRDGRAFDAVMQSKAIEYEGKPAILGIATDITELKRTTEALRVSEAKYRALVEHSIQGLAIVQGMPPRLVFLNQAIADIVGYSQEELLSISPEKIPSILDLEDAKAVFAKYPKRAAGEIGAERYELRVFRKDGTRCWLEVHVSRIEYEGEPAVQAVVIDISERKAAEASLRESEERYRELVELSPDPVVILQDGKFSFVNAAFHRVFGYTREDVDRGLSFFRLVQEKDVEAVRKRYEDRLAGKDLPRTFTLDLEAKDGTMIPTETSASLIQFEGRSADIVILRDISERVKAEKERFQLEIQIQQAQKMESLGILAGGIAHDFNNLLMGVLGNADLALADIAPENPARPYLQDIFASSKHLADLTRQMLAYSGRGRFVVEPIRLNRLVEEMAHLLKVSISKKATLKLDLSADIGTVMADASQIRQVILNLIVNASEALGDEEGVISLHTGQLDADAAYLSETYLDEGLKPGRFAMLSVSDTGQGMDRETQARIFDPFFTTKFTGRGLGLAAVLGIVRGHGSAIKVRSEPGKGTTFILLLPVEEDALPPAAATEATELAPTGGGTLLVVDDETTVRAILKKMLRNAGWDVIVASDGPEALGILERDADGFFAVLLDLTMPQMSGEETFKAIRRIRPSLPVVLMSGFDESDVLERFRGEDIAGFIHKPFEMKTIHDALRRALAR